MITEAQYLDDLWDRAIGLMDEGIIDSIERYNDRPEWPLNTKFVVHYRISPERVQKALDAERLDWFLTGIMVALGKENRKGLEGVAQYWSEVE